MRNVGVVGLGLIGGSLAGAMRRVRRGGRRLYHVSGFTRSDSSSREAVRRGLVDRSSSDPSVLSTCDIVVLSVPVQSMADVAAQIRPFLKKGAIVTDAGSVKSSVIRSVRRALKSRRDIPFVGSHPLAGSEKSGLAHADEKLFQKSICVIASVGAPSNAVRTVTALWKSVGAKTLSLSARDHDRFLAATSHLPHLLAFALFSQVANLSHTNSKVRSLVAGSFRDMTRIAASSPEIWTGIFDSNAAEVRRAWTLFSQNVRRLLQKRGSPLRRQLAALSRAREKWTSH